MNGRKVCLCPSIHTGTIFESICRLWGSFLYYALYFVIALHHHQIHGSTDASEKAVGAVLYVKFHTLDGIKVSLRYSRSKITPLKNLQSHLVMLLKLELYPAQLLAQFVDKIQRALNIEVEKYVFWTDNMIVLCFYSTASKWKSFVHPKNR